MADFKCEEEKLSSPITSVRWKAPKAASHPAGHSSAVIRSVWQKWQVLDLLSSFFFLSLFLSSSLFSHSLSLCHCFATGWPLTPPRLVGVVRELTIPACCATPAFICLFPLTSNNYSSWVLVVALILTLCSPTFSTLLLQGSHGSGKFIGELMSIVGPRN